MSDNNKTGRGMFGKGYYIALVLCAAAIGISGYLYYRNETAAQPVLQEPDQQQTQPAGAMEDDYPVGATLPQEGPTTGGTVPATQPQKRILKTAAPVSGETVAEYAMDCLSYNQTTRDWRVHNGIDIAAEVGTQVAAAADGEVYTVYEDDTMGTTVVIRHAQGYVTIYSSLSEEVAVKAGDTVTAGQVIGTVGSTALIETAMGPHVHFAATQNDVPMDPAEFLALGN